MRIIVGISGASGVILGYKLLQALKAVPCCETHLIISEGSLRTFEFEKEVTMAETIALADYYHENNNMAASIASGSFKTDGMIIVPCSMKTVSAIANGYASNLIARAADVCLKENRKVLVVPREMPLGKIHLKNLLALADLGCSIVPPMLTFYNNPQTIDDQVNHIVGKILMQFDIDYKKFVAWAGN